MVLNMELISRIIQIWFISMGTKLIMDIRVAMKLLKLMISIKINMGIIFLFILLIHLMIHPKRMLLQNNIKSMNKRSLTKNSSLFYQW